MGRRVTIQPLIRLRQSLLLSARLNNSSICFACDGNGIWAKAIVRRRFGCFVFVHWEHFDVKYDEYISIHSERIQPLNASELCNQFRSTLSFENALRIKPNKMKSIKHKKKKVKIKREDDNSLEK